MNFPFYLFLLASFCILHAVVVTIEKLSIKQLHSYDSKDEVKEEIDNQDVEHIFQGVDHTVEYGLQFRDSFDGLQGPQNSQNSQ